MNKEALGVSSTCSEVKRHTEKIFIIHFVESGQEEQSVSNIKAGVQQ